MHQLEPPLYFVFLLPRIKERKILLNFLLCFIVWLSVLTAWSGAHLFEYFSSTLSSSLEYPVGIKAIALFTYLILPFSPFLFLSLLEKNEIHYLFYCSIPFLLIPSYVSSRFALISALFASLSILAWSLKEIKRALPLFFLLLLFALGYMLSDYRNPFFYFKKPFLFEESFLNIFPTNFQQNTIPLSETENLEFLLGKLKENLDGEKILVHRSLLGYFLLAHIPREKLILIEDFTEFKVPNSNETFYTIWFIPGEKWHGIEKLPEEFRIVLSRGILALYKT